MSEKRISPAAPVANDDETKQPVIRKTTLGELGPQLPIGLLDRQGVLQKDLGVRAWRTKEERALARLSKKKNMASYVGGVLAMMLTKVGEHSWLPMPENAKKVAERQAVLGTMFAGDVFYAYCWLRREAIGPDVVLNVACGTCGNKFSFTGDLDTLEVTTVDDLKALEHQYKLKYAFEARKKTVETLRLTGIRWCDIESAPFGDEDDETMGKIVALKSAIIGFNDGPDIRVTDAEMDEISKRDLEAASTAINANHIGAQMSVECECPKCETNLRVPLDWRYNNFFGFSSL